MLPNSLLFAIAVLFSAALGFRIFQIIIRRTEKRGVQPQLSYSVNGALVFCNAKELAKKFPHTRTTTSLLEKIAPGWFVQIATGTERFWVKIHVRDGENLFGVVETILNDTKLHGLEYGDDILFSMDNVFEVQKPNTLEINPVHLQNLQKKNSNN